MKIKVLLFSLLILITYVFNACKDSGTDPENGGGTQVADSTYFPTENGAYYKYDIARTDSNGAQSTGTRSSFYSGTQVIAGTNYQLQVDSLILTGQAPILDSMYFRKSETGVFFNLDTTGFAASVPGLDTLLQYITLDSEVRLLLLPILDNSGWTAFRMNINYQILNFDPVVLSGKFDGTESLQLNLNPPRTVDAVRIRFTLSIKMDPFEEVRTYTAFGWIAQNIGFVKWQGNGTVVGVFTGNGVDFDDTTSVYTQNITQFNLIDN
ncbi:MAG: hypothetical protein EHM47_09695 [Ignavibacteriales bacterium]|nr:MAG: hypothetical protein EHM47_09695 [Ignavibacteriales bacterium]